MEELNYDMGHMALLIFLLCKVFFLYLFTSNWPKGSEGKELVTLLREAN
jgi:hypothetical protein